MVPGDVGNGGDAGDGEGGASAGTWAAHSEHMDRDSEGAGAGKEEADVLSADLGVCHHGVSLRIPHRATYAAWQRVRWGREELWQIAVSNKLGCS